MLKYICLILILPLSANLCAQKYQKMLPFENNGKWGYMNIYKEIVIEPKYQEAYPGSHNRFRVKDDGKYGYIDKEGQEIIKAEFEEATEFNYNRATVTLDGSSYIIDQDGEKSEPIHRECGFHTGCYRPYQTSSSSFDIIETNDKVQLVKKHGRFPGDNLIYPKEYKLRDTADVLFDTIITLNETCFYVMKDSRFTFINAPEFFDRLFYDQDSSYRVSIFYRPKIEDVKQFECRDSRCFDKNVFIGIKQNGLWGYNKLEYGRRYFITRHLDPKYLSIGSLANGHALVEYEKGKYGYIDREGNEYFIR